MGILGWITLGVALGAIAHAAGAVQPDHGRLDSIGAAVAGALLGGFAGAAAGLGALSAFFAVGTWVTAAGGALMLVELRRRAMGGRLMAPELRERDVRQANR